MTFHSFSSDLSSQDRLSHPINSIGHSIGLVHRKTKEVASIYLFISFFSNFYIVIIVFLIIILFFYEFGMRFFLIQSDELNGTPEVWVQCPHHL